MSKEIIPRIKKFIYTIDSSEKINYYLAIFQLIAGVSGFLYSNYKDNTKYDFKWSLYTFILFQTIVLFFFLMLIAISGRYRAIKLRLSKNAGYLYDKTSNIRNVSLRAETLKIILDEIKDQTILYDAGKKSGSSFFEDFDRIHKLKDKDYTIQEKLEKWVEYDSSSGMGKFDLVPTEGSLDLKLKITNPFVEDCQGKRTNMRCEFLRGYIDGFLSRLYGKEMKAECEHIISPTACKFTITYH